MKRRTAARISDFQWGMNTLHNDVVTVCPSREINVISRNPPLYGSTNPVFARLWKCFGVFFSKNVE